MSAIKARLFGPGSPVTGEPAELCIEHDGLAARTANAHHRVAIGATRVRTVGLDEAGLEFAWDAEDGPRAVQITDAAALRALCAHPAVAAAPQLAALRASQRRSKAGRLLGWSALSVFVLFPALLLLIFLWQSDRIALAAAERIPIEKEVSLGEQAFAGMRGSLNLHDDGPAFAAVQTLGERLTQGSRYTYRFHVADNDQINAFALPGGIVVVHSALIAATKRPEELAGVLAHEVQHVEQRHSLQAMIKELGLRGLWLWVTGDASGVLSQAAVQLTTLSFSRNAEAQADGKGFDALARAGIDPAGMADFFATLAKQQADAPAFLSTHPASGDREQTLRARRAELQQRSFAPLDFGQWPP